MNIENKNTNIDESRLPSDPNKDPEFGVPEEKKYPLFDKSHVESAIRLFGHVNPKYESELAHKIVAKMKEYNIPFDMVGEDSPLYKYLPKSELEESFKQAYNNKDGDKIHRYIQGQARAIRMSDKRKDSNSKDAARANFEKRANKKFDKTDANGSFQKAYNNGGEDLKKHISDTAWKERNYKPIKISGKGTEVLEKMDKKLDHARETVEGQFEKYAKRHPEPKKEKINEGADITVPLNAIRSDLQSELTAIKDYDSHADTCEELGLADAATVLRDIRDEEKVHVGELQKLLSKYDTQYEGSLSDGEEEAEKMLSESVLDPVHKERCIELWNDNKLKSEVKKFILDTLNEFKKQIEYDIPIKNIYLIGSSTGYQYTDTSDVDCSVIIEKTLSDDQYRNIIKIIPNGHNIPGTQHPVNYFITTELKEKNAENIYDVINDTWLKQTPKEESELPTGYILELAKFFMNSLDLTFNEYLRDKQEYLEYKSMDPNEIEISEKEKQEAMDKKMTEIKADLDSLRIGNHVIRGFVHEAYESEDNQYSIHIEIENPNKDPRKSINNLVYKCLEKFGYRTKLDNIITDAENFIKAESAASETLAEAKKVPTIAQTEDEHEIYRWKNPETGEFEEFKSMDDKEERIKSFNASRSDKKVLEESVSYIDNAGNLKQQKTTKEYVEDMHKHENKSKLGLARYQNILKAYKKKD